VSTPLERLHDHGQSTWLDFIRRAHIDSGQLQRLIDDGWISGLTSNPTIFGRAIEGSTDYDDELREIARSGHTDPYEAFVRLASADLRRAADALRPIYDATGAADGYVSFELPPGVEHDAARSIAEARRLRDAVGRPNVMIKVPGTEAGALAVEELTAAGLNVNITLLFDVAVYERIARAYIAGLGRALETGRELSTIASVASFFVSRVDTAADRELPEGSALRGTVGVGNARIAYRRFEEIFAGPAWERLAAAGARVQRPLWASTGTKNPAYSDVLYVDGLIAPDTVNTLPEATLRAFAGHGDGAAAITEAQLDGAAGLPDALAADGVDLEAVTDRLLVEGLATFEADFQALLGCIGKALRTIEAGRARHGGSLGALEAPVEAAVEALARDDVTGRLWAGDHTLWAEDPTEISDRLGWLTVAEDMTEQAADLEAFGASVAADGIAHVVLLGMGGSSLAPEVLATSFGSAPGRPELIALDTTDPAEIAAVEARVDLARTLFVVASKSGTTLETLSHLAYFWERVPDGAHFVCITDPGTPLEATARERGFRRVFANPPEIGGRYSALSYFGLVPAALAGVDLAALLDSAVEMQTACHSCVPTADNPGARLGAAIGAAARAGHDKLTLVLPEEIASFGGWVEQLIAESTGKHGRGILPVDGEPLGPPEVYGNDRLFVALGEDADLDALERAGHPVVTLPFEGPAQLGGEFYRWEFATAVAGHLLTINPFDQPNVQQAKDATARILDGADVDAATPPLDEVLARVAPGDYIALQAFLPRTEAHARALQAARVRLRDRYRAATTVGFGPRFLHSTGQLHKGGAANGVFIQIVGDDPADLAIPGAPYSFGALKQAQALGDLDSLRAQGRRVTRISLADLERLGA
jgi:transaldolase/glucose-6-phosphate isomerase